MQRLSTIYWDSRSLKVIHYGTIRKPVVHSSYDTQHVHGYLQPFAGYNAIFVVARLQKLIVPHFDALVRGEPMILRSQIFVGIN